MSSVQRQNFSIDSGCERTFHTRREATTRARER